MKLHNKIASWYFSKKALPFWLIFIIDCFTVLLSGFLAWIYFSNAHFALVNFGTLLNTLLFYLLFYILAFRLFHTYSSVLRYSSFMELQRIVWAIVLGTVMAFTFHYFLNQHLPIKYFMKIGGNIILIMGMIALFLIIAGRLLIKTFHDNMYTREGATPMMIYGIGEEAVALAKRIRNDKSSQFVMKGFIAHTDDYHYKYMMGERVYKVDEDLFRYMDKLPIGAILVPTKKINSFKENLELQDMALNSGAKIYFLKESISEDSGQVDFKQVKIEDLLSRDVIQVDMNYISEQIVGKTLLITGSAGSIGSELVRQIAACHPAKLVLVDQAETPQHDIRLMMQNEWSFVPSETIVTSMCNKTHMERIFAENKPDYVFHAAAYKHVPMMEDNPSESILNNVYGTKVLADLAVKYGVRKFVMISTDKAVNPTNVMGCSKRICEIYVQSLDEAIKAGTLKEIDGDPVENPRTQFVTTRFGNVLGSNGSVIPLFRKQIEAGGPVTVTHPDIIRYFMLIPEACRLVLEAAAHGKGGEIFVFDMGKPVRIADLAKKMIKLSGAEGVQIKYTGLRPGEKLYEEVLSDKEQTLPTFNEKIRIANVRKYVYSDVDKRINDLIAVSRTCNDREVVIGMKQLVPEYKSQHSKWAELDEAE